MTVPLKPFVAKIPTYMSSGLQFAVASYYKIRTNNMVIIQTLQTITARSRSLQSLHKTSYLCVLEHCHRLAVSQQPQCVLHPKKREEKKKKEKKWTSNPAESLNTNKSHFILGVQNICLHVRVTTDFLLTIDSHRPGQYHTPGLCNVL